MCEGCLRCWTWHARQRNRSLIGRCVPCQRLVAAQSHATRNHTSKQTKLTPRVYRILYGLWMFVGSWSLNTIQLQSSSLACSIWCSNQVCGLLMVAVQFVSCLAVFQQHIGRETIEPMTHCFVFFKVAQVTWLWALTNQCQVATN